ncbi:MAG: hypothetical protein Tsb002_11820 [Wenzhouxiangellaceae bacterium]
MASRLTPKGFLLRFLGALVLVFASFNPSGFSFVHWAVDDSVSAPLRLLIGVLLAIGWVIFVRATIRSLGMLGMILVAVLLGTLVWLAVDLGWLALDNVDALSYVLLVLLSLMLAVGMSWSHIRRRMSGQVDVDELDD